MKTFFRVTMLGLLMCVITAFSAVAIMAQDDDQKEKTALYTCFVENYDKYTMEQQKKALGCAKKYIEKFPDDTQYVTYFKGQIPALEDWIKEEEERLAAIKDRQRKEAETKARIDRFNSSYKAAAEAKTLEIKDWQEYFSAADDVISNEKAFSLDVKILSAAAGARYIAGGKAPVDAYNNKIIDYAESAISDINSGKTSKSYGIFNFKYDNKGKALAELNKVIAYIKLERQGKKEDGIAQYYKSLQYNKDWNTYRIIGSWYLNQVVDMLEDRKNLDPKKEEDLAKIKESLAMERGYAARAIDAYARAYSLAKADTKVSEDNKKALFDRLKELFDFRYTQPREAPMKTVMSINNYVATVNGKQMPDPKTKVEPIALEEEKPEMDKAVDGEKEGADKSSKDGSTRSRTVSKVKPAKN